MANLDLLQQSPKDRNYRYPINSRGLFIVVENNRFEYKFEVKTVNTKMGIATKFNTTSLDNIRDMLVSNFDGDLLGINKFLSRDCSKGENGEYTKKPFVGFIREIAKEMKAKRIKPSFLMFILVSAGVEFGQFLLQDGEDCYGCSKDKHQYTERCQARRVSDLVRAIQEAEGKRGALFSGIPKIFLIQTVSGVDPAIYRKGPKEDVEKLKQEDFTPRGSDTFVFYAHTHESVKWVNKNGFYLLDKFCAAVEDCEKADKSIEANNMLRSLSNIWEDPAVTVDDKDGLQRVNQSLLQSVNDSVVKQFPQLALTTESLVGSWFDNVCTATSANITKFLEEEEKKKKISYANLRAHMSSTLRYRLSVTDMLKSQPAVDTNNDK